LSLGHWHRLERLSHPSHTDYPLDLPLQSGYAYTLSYVLLYSWDNREAIVGAGTNEMKKNSYLIGAGTPRDHVPCGLNSWEESNKMLIIIESG
jgi:hypothetical protein